MARLTAIVIALMASTAMAMPAVVIEKRQFTYTIGPVISSADGTKVLGATAEAAYPPYAGGDLGGALTADATKTVYAGEAVGTLGPANDELKVSIVQGNGKILGIKTIGGCIGGSLAEFGDEECEDLPLPRRTAAPVM